MQRGRSIVLVGESQAVEPVGPVVVEVTVDPDLVPDGRTMAALLTAHRTATIACTGLRTVRRRMTRSATARLITQARPWRRAMLRSLVPTTASPMPRVNTCVPAPKAIA